MTSSVQNEITNLQNNTQINKASQPKTHSDTITGDDFLYLLTQQLQYQDPLNPMDNTDMLAQEAQFASLEQLESLSSSFSHFANVFQASSLMGQVVEVQGSDGSVVGTVEYIDYRDANGACVSIDGQLYPISNIMKVYPEGTDPSAPTDGTGDLGSVDDTEDVDNSQDTDKTEDAGSDSTATTSGQALLESINENISKIANKLKEYIK